MRNLFVTAALLLPAAAFAGGYAVPNTNARDLAMAGSAGAAQKDATAAYVNPAALSGLEGLSVVVNGTMIDFRSTWNAPDGSASSQSNLIPSASSTCRVAAVISGPMPSPGISVASRAVTAGPGSGSSARRRRARAP